MLGENSQPKTEARWVAEHSIIGSICLLIVIALTHFYPIEEEDAEMKAILEQMPPSDRWLYEMVEAFYGKPVRVRDRWLILNSDDSREYACEDGIEPDNSATVGLVAKAALPDRGSLSIHHQEETKKKFNGIGIKRHLFTCAEGDAGPAVYRVYLSAEEMPKKDWIMWKVPRLCPGGFGVNGSTKPGYILFLVKGVKGMEERFFRWVRKVHFEFIDDCSEIHGGWVRGTPIGEEHVAVHWCDGDTSQLASIVGPDSIEEYKNHGVVVNKHNSSRTGGEQLNDRMTVFKCSKRLIRKMNSKSIPNHDLRRILNAKFAEYKKKGLLLPKKPNVLLDYFVKQQSILTRTLYPENIIVGYVANGMLDKKMMRVPVLSTIVRTCKRIPEPILHNLIYETFPKLMNYAYPDMKYIGDPMLIELGFPPDKRPNGEDFIRDKGISQEAQQRAKCLTGNAEVSLRAKLVEEAELAKQARDDRALTLAARGRREEQERIAKLCTAANLPPSEDNVAKCEMEHFNKLYAPELHQFVYGHHPTLRTLSQIRKLKKPKTALADALSGVRNLVSVAFECKGEKSRFLASSSDSENHSERNATGTSTAASLPTIRILNDIMPVDPDAIGVKASDILRSPEKLAAIRAAFDPDGNYKMLALDELAPEVLSEELARADLLCDMLRSRMPWHVRNKVEDPSKRILPVWSWARKNMIIPAAWMVLVGHAKKNIQSIGERGSLLNPSTNNFLVCANSYLHMWGAYLVRDTGNDQWRRSGSASGEAGMGGRWKEHERRARMDRNDDNSLFYDTFPSVHSKREGNRLQEGHFEDLVQYVAVTFKNDDATMSEFMKDYAEGGLFFYTDEDKRRISSTNFRGKTTVPRKFGTMVAYQFELAYELSLDRRLNVS